MKKYLCRHCKREAVAEDNKSLVQDMFCLGCRWDLHHSRRWDNRHTTKEEWMILNRRVN